MNKIWKTSKSGKYNLILAGAVVASANTLVTAISAVILTAIVVRSLPRELSGVFFLCINFGALIMLADLGISPTLSREIAFATAGRDEESSNLRILKLLGTVVRISISIATVILVLSIFFGLIYFQKTVNPVFLKEVQNGWIIFAIGSALNVLSGSGFSGLYGIGLVSIEGIGRIVVQISGLLLGVVAIVCGFGFSGLCLAWLAQGCISCITSWSLLIYFRPSVKNISLKYDGSIIRQFLKPSLKWSATSLSVYMTFNAISLIVGAILGPAEVSEFALVARMGQLALALSLAFSGSASPHISREFAAGNMVEVKQILVHNLRLGMALCISLLTILVLFAEKIIGLWVGSGHFAGYAVLIPYFIMIALQTHHSIHSSAVMATGNLPFLLPTMFSGILSIILSLILINKFSLVGASFAILISQLVAINWYAPYYSYLLFFRTKLSKS